MRYAAKIAPMQVVRACASVSSEHEPSVVLPVVCILDVVPDLQVFIAHRNDSLSEAAQRTTRGAPENGESMSFCGEVF